MRLSDHLMAECGGEFDIGGIFTKTCALIADAERFELSDDVARAAYNLTKSKPSTLVSALPLCRAPFRKMWFEWRGGLTSDMIRREHKRDALFAPDPLKQGCLIVTDATGQCGNMTFAWLHKEKPGMKFTPVNISPLGAIFDWTENANITLDAIDILRDRYPNKARLDTPLGFADSILFARYSRQLTDDDAKAWMQRSAFHDWNRFAHLQSERIALQSMHRRCMPFVPDNTYDFLKWVADTAAQTPGGFEKFMSGIVTQSWEADIEGEPPFAETVIAMMNSRNAIEHRSVDLTALNKSRVKRGRSQFLPYRTTHLRLSQAQTRAFRAGLLSREDAGKHRVRGHFKIRKTGVYWWSPFFRGDPAKSLHRAEYKVEV